MIKTLFSTDGIITRISDTAVGDRMADIITPERGRISVCVKGGKSPVSKLGGISQLFTYGNYEIYEKNSMYWMRGGSIICPFYEISNEIERLALGTYLCEVANDLTGENEESREILRLLLNTLYLVGKGEKSRIQLKAVFEIRAMCISGYCPELSGCIYCKKNRCEFMYLDILRGRLICSDCLSKRENKTISISDEFEYTEQKNLLFGMTPAVFAAFCHVVYSQPGKIFAFEIKDKTELEDFGKIAETYLLEHLGHGFKSLDFYRSVK